MCAGRGGFGVGFGSGREVGVGEVGEVLGSEA